MISYRGYGARAAVAAFALFCMWSSAVPQQSGTVAHQTLTFAGASTAVVQIEVAGFKSPDTTTELLIEFIRDGNGGASPPPDPSLPAAAKLTLSASIGGTRDFPLTSSTLDMKTFPDKTVSVGRLDSANSPALYSVTITHARGIPVGVTETWTVTIGGLPRTGLRTMASIQQGVFRSLDPTGVSAAPPGISIAPGPVLAGSAAAFRVNSVGGLDLSHVGVAQVTIAPGEGISNLALGTASAGSVGVSFSVAPCALAGARTLTVTTPAGAASAVFAIARQPQVPAISISPDRVETSSSPTLTVTPSGCFDLAGVTAAQVSITPAEGISDFGVRSSGGSNVVVSFHVETSAQTGQRTLTINSGGTTAAAGFVVDERPPPPHHDPDPEPCVGPDLKCCKFNGSICTKCVPAGIHACQ